MAGAGRGARAALRRRPRSTRCSRRPRPVEGPGAAEAGARRCCRCSTSCEPDVVVSDILTLAPSLAAELRGVPRVTLVPHLYPVHDPGMPFFGMGLAPPRSGLGRRLWRAGLPVLETGLRRGRRELNETRARLGLPPLERFHGGISEELVIVATLPQLEYPREWPPEVMITGPLGFEIPHPDIELPAGRGSDRPRRVEHGPGSGVRPDPALLRGARRRAGAGDCDHERTLPGAADRRAAERHPGRLALLLAADAACEVVVCHGGHGTVARALARGDPWSSRPRSATWRRTRSGLRGPAPASPCPGGCAAARRCAGRCGGSLEDPSYRGRAEEIAASESARGAAAAVAAEAAL